MKIILLIIMAQQQIATSNKNGVLVEYHPDCTTKAEIIQNVESGLICFNSETAFRDEIFIGSFDALPRNPKTNSK